MSTLLQGTVPIQAGPFTSAPFAVPDGIKRPGLPLAVTLTLDSQPFPAGTTTVEIGISTDGGSSYKFAGMSCGPGVLFRGAFAPWVLSYTLGPNDQPTHVRYRTNAPSSFSASATLTAS